MIQCETCQYFKQNENGEISLSCDPFHNVLEPECLAKWQLIKLNQMGAQVGQMAQAYQATLGYYQKLAPMQEKMFKFMEREIDDVDESDSWKQADDDDDDNAENDHPWDNSSQ